MAYRKMTQLEICKRIGRGDLVVYVDEEYGYRQWYWFPDMTEEELLKYWEKCQIEDYYFSPAGLPGDMVPVPAEDWAAAGEDYVDYSTNNEKWRKATRLLEKSRRPGATDEDRQKFAEAHDEWNRETFPNEQSWYDGFHSENTWRAHTHMDDDSWLKKPGEPRYRKWDKED